MMPRNPWVPAMRSVDQPLAAARSASVTVARSEGTTSTIEAEFPTTVISMP